MSDVVQTQGQMLSALMETQNRLLQCVVQRVAKNTERLVSFTSALLDKQETGWTAWKTTVWSRD